MEFNKMTPMQKYHWLKKQIKEQEQWIEEHGGTEAEYIQRYGTEASTNFKGAGGAKIFDADFRALLMWQDRLKATMNAYPEIQEELSRKEEEHQRRLQEAKVKAEKYRAEEDKILSGIPEEFRSWFSYKAYEEGHSAGYEEVLNCLRGLLDGFEECLQKYTQSKYGKYLK